MKKSFMNIKNFVDSNVRQRIDRVSNNNNDFFENDLLNIEKQFDDLKQVCIEAEKKISALLQSINPPSTLVGTYTQNVQASLSNLTTVTSTTSPVPTINSSPTLLFNHETKSLQYGSSSTSSTGHSSNEYKCNNNSESSNNSPSFNKSNDNLVNSEDMKKHKKLPIIGFLKFLNKACNKLKPDSLLTSTLSHCSKLQIQLTDLYLNYEQSIELHCLKPIQQILETDVPNVIKLRKIFIKSHNDLESVKAKYTGMNLKQQQQQQQSHNTSQFSSSSYTVGQSNAQQANAIKLDQLKTELDDAIVRYEQSKDTYATELYAFVCRESELVDLFTKLYRYQAEYHQQVASAIQFSLPPLANIIATTPRKVIFGMPIQEHLSHTGRAVSLVIDVSIHLLYLNALNEEGLFRIPGSAVKVKKLKNAINAWFVTLASQKELETTDLPTHSGNSTGNSAAVYAIYNLFKDIIAQRPQSSKETADSPPETNIPSAVLEDSNGKLRPVVPPPPVIQNRYMQQQLVFDVHTIAGLLKLYLRELPEPLLTHSLYDEWISVAVRTSRKESTEISFRHVISKLPEANYENLRHLIRFLHILTCHREQNKMTATNLAITMAPSLIWSKPLELVQNREKNLNHDSNDEELNNIDALNAQMSNIGMSASLHAVIIENLITQAEQLFPGQIQFTLPGFTRSHKLNNKANRNSSLYS